MNKMNQITEELIEERSKCRNFSIFKKRNPTLVNILLNDSCFSNHNNNLQKKAACIILGYEPVCIVCDKEVNFIGHNNKSDRSTVFGSFRRTCSQKCSGKDPMSLQKIKQTSLEKYGTEHFTQNESVKNRNKKTNLEKYGFDHPLKNEKVKEKLKNTCLSKYGLDSFFKTKKFKEIIKQTSLEKYGFDHHLKSDYIKNKRKLSNLEKYGVDHIMKVSDNSQKSRNTYLKNSLFENINLEFKNLLLENDLSKIKEFLEKVIIENSFDRRKNLSEYLNYSVQQTNRLLQNLNIEHYFPAQYISTSEQEVADFVKSLGLEIEQSNRSILNGKELDIYIPSKNLAIEFDGIYWHSINNGTDKNYHLDKTLECEKQKIQLLHIFESEWEDSIKQEIWKSIIKAKLGIFDRRIYARKCQIKVIDSKTTKLFLNNNHLQGHVNTKNYLGLFYNDELVSVVSYGKSRFKDKETEIIRFATLLNTQIIGGFSKLLKAVKTDNLISFADRRYSSSVNSVYSKFTDKIEISGPSFWIYDEGVLKHRLGFQKHLLKNKLKNFNINETAMNNILDNYLVIYDCGHIKYNFQKG